MNLVTISATISTALALYCVVPYVLSILRGRTRPHQLSWLVFVIMNGIVLFSQYFEGGRASVLVSLVFFGAALLNFLLSLKYGVRESSKWDKSLFIFSLLTIVVWILTKSNSAAIWLTILIDVAATTMIILKVKSQPDSEDPYPWAIATVAYVFACLTLVGTPISILYVRPMYGLVCDGALVAFIYYLRSVSKKNVTKKR